MLQLGMRSKGRRQTYTELPTYIQADGNDTTPVSSRPSSTKSNQNAGDQNVAGFISTKSSSRKTVPNSDSVDLSKYVKSVVTDVQSKNKVLAIVRGTGGSSSSNSKKVRRRTLG